MDLGVKITTGEDAVGEVGPVEVANEEFGVFECELMGDVFADLFGGGGGEGVDGAIGENLFEIGELAVFGAEVVAPVADAVGFIDGDGADAGVAEGVVQGGPPTDEAFGGEVEHVEVAIAEVVEDLAAFIGGEGGVELRGGDAEGAEGIDLVFHEGDEGRDDDGGALAEL